MPEFRGSARALAILAAHWAAVSVLGWTDFLADSEVRVGLMYVPLVASATALLGRRAGLATAGYATVTLLLANDLRLPFEVAVFNNVVRVVGFGTVALLVDRVVRQTRTLRLQQQQLERELATRTEYTSLVAH